MKLISFVVCSLLLALPANAATVSLISGALFDFSASPVGSTDGSDADLVPLSVERFGQPTCPDLFLAGTGTLTGVCTGGAIITNGSENTRWAVEYARSYYAFLRAFFEPDETDFLFEAFVDVSYTAGPLGRPDLTTDVGRRLTMDDRDILDGAAQTFTSYSGLPFDGEATLVPTSSPLLIEYTISFTATITDPAPVPLPGTVFLLAAALPFLRLIGAKRTKKLMCEARPHVGFRSGPTRP